MQRFVLTLNKFRVILAVFTILGVNFVFADFSRVGTQVATARSELASAQKAIVAKIFADNIDTKKQKAPHPNNPNQTIEWGEWIMEVAKLNKKRWTTLGTNGIYPIIGKTICYDKSETPLLWIDTKTGTMHFNPSKLSSNDKGEDFCEKLRDSYRSNNGNGDKLIPLATSSGFSGGNVSNNDDLVNAAIQGNLDKVKTLIKNGAKINTRDSRGTLALVGAATTGKLEMVKFLISQGADVNASANLNRNNNINALMMASANGHLEVVKILVENGANVNAKTDDGGTALMMASAYGHLKIVDYLIENGADSSAKDSEGKTALEYLNKYKK